MPLPQLNVHRHDRATCASIALTGEIDRATAPLIPAALTTCLRDGISTADVDLTVTFCDVGGLNAFLTASGPAADAGGTLRLHHPPPSPARIIEIAGSGFLLHDPEAVRPLSRRIPAAVGGTR
jgi:anti-sigma B factor antagonist